MKRAGRNDPCPCGSGRKYKQCCLRGEVTEGRGERSGAVSVAALIREAIAHHQAGRLSEAITSYRGALSIEPHHAKTHNNLGNALRDVGRLNEAAACFRSALRIDPDYAKAHNNLGNVLRDQGKLDEAVACYQRALVLEPNYAEAHNNLGAAWQDQGRLDEAVTCYQKALVVKPHYAEAYNNLGAALQKQDKRDEAVACCRKAVALRPDYAEACNNLGALLQDQGEPEEALAWCRRALGLKPDYAEAYNNLGNVLRDLGRRDEGMASYRKALSLRPDLAAAHHALIYSTVQSEEADAAAVFAECRRFAEQFEKGMVRLAHNNDPDPARRLKVGYVSGDLRQHAVAYFIEPVLASHDHGAVEVFCYYNHRLVDHVSERLMGYCDHWRSIAGVFDDKVAALIQEDGIDILVDLSGHTNHNRLLVFARKPAPVQVTWIGLPCTTGLSAMDYRFSNRYGDPVGMSEKYHTETLFRLSFSGCYQPETDLPPVSELPALVNGCVTFCSFNNPQKISAAVIAVWSRILASLPGSRLMMICQQAFRQAFREQFAAAGIGQERLVFFDRLPMRDYLALHNDADIALDSFPYNGGTTTRNSLWMGVPAVTLAGRRTVSRLGLAINSQTGLDGFVADNEEEYVHVALRWGRDLAGLAQVRRSLRGRVQAAPFSNPKACTREVEAAYRQMWRTWCATRQSGDSS